MTSTPSSRQVVEVRGDAAPGRRCRRRRSRRSCAGRSGTRRRSVHHGLDFRPCWRAIIASMSDENARGRPAGDRAEPGRLPPARGRRGLRPRRRRAGDRARPGGGPATGARVVQRPLRRRTAGPSDPLRDRCARTRSTCRRRSRALALAALESGRWTVEPGTSMLVAHGEGPAPDEHARPGARAARARLDDAGWRGDARPGTRALERWLADR